MMSLITMTSYKGASLNNRSEEHTSELQSLRHLVCRLLLDKKIYYLSVRQTGLLLLYWIAIRDQKKRQIHCSFLHMQIHRPFDFLLRLLHNFYPGTFSVIH